nr:hypothetical protein [Egibacter rhizosphaerae]
MHDRVTAVDHLDEPAGLVARDPFLELLAELCSLDPDLLESELALPDERLDRQFRWRGPEGGAVRGAVSQPAFLEPSQGERNIGGGRTERVRELRDVSRLRADQ